METQYASTRTLHKDEKLYSYNTQQQHGQQQQQQPHHPHPQQPHRITENYNTLSHSRQQPQQQQPASGSQAHQAHASASSAATAHLDDAGAASRTSGPARRDSPPPSSSSTALRDFVHAGPPPLRRLSAPSLPGASSSSFRTSAGLPSPLPPLPSALSHHQHHQHHASDIASSSSARPYLPAPAPSLAPRAHAPPPAIHIPTGRASNYGRAAYNEPQTAPLVAPPRSPHFAQHQQQQQQPPLSGGRIPLSPISTHVRSLLAPPYGPSGSASAPSSASASSSAPLDEYRALRSPHPPLTALYPQHPWPPQLPAHVRSDVSAAAASSAQPDGDHHHPRQRPYLSSPLGDGPSSASSTHHSHGFPYNNPSHRHIHGGSHHPHAGAAAPQQQRTNSQQGHAQTQPLSPAYLSAPPLYSSGPPRSNTTRTHSPLFIPPPLRFKYSVSPPPHSAYPEMPPRKKVAGSTATVTSTPQTVSSARSSRRIAGSIPDGKGGNGWTTEHTYDSIGQPKEIIVIQDSASPIPKKRTRAAVAAAAESAKWNGSAGSHPAPAAAINGSSTAAKRRKLEEEAEAKKGKAKATNSSTSVHTQPAPPLPLQPQAHIQQPAPATATSGTQAPAWDDAEGHYIVKPDDVIGGRYKIVRLLGQGTFGKVVEARHIESRRKVAIKVIRAVQKYRDASKIEIRVLETLKKNDPENNFKCIHLSEYFDFRNHPCLVSDLYGMSVFDFLKLNHFQPFPERHIQDFAKSLLASVQFLHSLKLVHTDLKPENILLVSNESRLSGPRRANARSKSILRNTDIRLIDFGSATFANEYHSSVVSTRHYRAPEIILGLSWSYPCDMFSIGCILVEFFTGDALFQTHDNLEHLAMMEVVMGKMPSRMIERGRLKKPEFFKGNKIDFPNPSVSKSSRKFVKGLKALKDIIPSTNPTNALFLDLVVRLLDFDPETRITVDQALRHPYLRQTIPEPP